MPQSPRSLQLTETYRSRLFALRDQVTAQALRIWPDDPGETDWNVRAASIVEVAQRGALRLTGAYLTAFLASETGRRTRAISVDSEAFSGLTADGQPLAEGLRSSLIGALAALKEGKSYEAAQRIGRNRAQRQIGMNYDAAHRPALLEAIDRDERFDGWNRALRGTCGACAAKATGPTDGLLFQAHPHCQCVSEPRVAGVTDRFPRPTGLEVFAAKTREEQDEMVGPEAAEKVRSGEITLASLASESHLDSDADDILTQAPA